MVILKETPAVKRNLLDKAIEVIAPRMAVRRLQARAVLALAGGYTGAKIDRASLGSWRPGGGSPTADIVDDLPLLRERSRDLARNTPVATGAIGTQVTHVVGTGLSMQPSIDADFLGLSESEADAWHVNTKREWKLWAESRDCDAARTLDFYGIQRQAFRGVLESGDCFVLTPNIPNRGRPLDLALQVIEADRVMNPDHARNTETLVEGIEFAETGEPRRYHVASTHPGEMRRVSKWDAYEAYGKNTGRRNVLHLFEQLRPGQPRGVPCLAPVIEPLKQLGRYTDAELNAAVVSGLWSVFIKMDPEAFQALFDDDAKKTLLDQSKDWSGEMESGKAVNLLPGESVEAPNPGRPNSEFDPFVTSILRQIGMALEIPFEVLVMHYQSSYSAARAAMLTAWRFFRARRDWLAGNLCQPVYELFLAEAVARGRISAPGFFADAAVRSAWCGAEWVGDGPGSLDPVKEVDAAEKRVKLGTSTLEAESVLHDGVGWEGKHAQRAKEVRMRRAAGLDIEPTSERITTEPV